MLSNLLAPSDTTTVASGTSFSSAALPVTVINLSHKNLSSHDLSCMAEQFGIEPTVHTLRLGFNDFGDDGAKVIASLLEKFSSITCLDLGFCNIGDVGMEALAKHISLINCNIEVLYLSGNCLTPMGFKHLSDALSTNKSLQTLYITANKAGSEGAKWIAKGLQLNHQLTSLTMNVNKIDSEGASYIADSLAMNDAMTHLNLSDNNIGDKGMISISQAMANHKNIKELELSFNKISPIGISSFIDNVIGYRLLTRLFLDNNKISDAGAQSLALAIPHMQLTELNISFNEIGATGLISVIQCVQTSPSIKKLWLSGNGVDNDVAKALATMLLKNCVLHTLYMDNCAISTMGERFIGTGIASNKKSSLRLLTGFELAKVLVLLGSPPQIGELSNEAALRYLSQMWMHVEKNSPAGLSSASNTTTASTANQAGGTICTSNGGVNTTTTNSSQGMKASISGCQNTPSPSIPKRPSSNNQRHLSGNRLSGESLKKTHSSSGKLQGCVVTQESAVTEGGEAAQKGDDVVESAEDDDEEFDSEDDDDDSEDDSYYTSDESCYSRASTSSPYELNYVYPDDERCDDHNEESEKNIREAISSSPDKLSGASNIPQSTSTKSIQSISRANSGSSKRHHHHHHHHHYSSSDFEDSQKTEHRLRTYIVNPEVLDVAKKISTIPFSGAELWELHQYYYSPPPSTASCRSMANFLDMSNKRASLSEISSHGVVAPSSSHGRPLVVEADNGSEDGFERPTKKQSNVKTMARINLYSRIKRVLETFTSVGDDFKTLLLLRRLRYIEDCSGIYDTNTVESILIDDIMEGKI